MYFIKLIVLLLKLDTCYQLKRNFFIYFFNVWLTRMCQSTPCSFIKVILNINGTHLQSSPLSQIVNFHKQIFLCFVHVQDFKSAMYWCVIYWLAISKVSFTHLLVQVVVCIEYCFSSSVDNYNNVDILIFQQNVDNFANEHCMFLLLYFKLFIYII